MENRTGGNIIQEELQFRKVQTNGSLCHITAIFGMMLAGEVIKGKDEEDPLCLSGIPPLYGGKGLAR